jgi:hypothetical protein
MLGLCSPIIWKLMHILKHVKASRWHICAETWRPPSRYWWENTLGLCDCRRHLAELYNISGTSREATKQVPRVLCNPQWAKYFWFIQRFLSDDSLLPNCGLILNYVWWKVVTTMTQLNNKREADYSNLVTGKEKVKAVAVLMPHGSCRQLRALWRKLPISSAYCQPYLYPKKLDCTCCSV